MRDGRLIVVGGASRSGKTEWVKKATARRRRVFAWDPEAQWCEIPGWKRVTSRAELLALAQKPGAMKVAYVAGGNLSGEFNYWAGCAMYSTRYVQPTDAVAEELADVTTPSKAPGNWGILLRRGLKRGGNIYAISQRWQEADKTAMGNALLFIFFRQNGPEAANYLAKKTGVPADQIPSAPLEYVEFDPTTGKILKKKLSF